MNKKLFLIVAGSGTGKDYVVDKLCKEFHKEKVISRTTRKKRFKYEDTHMFVPNIQADIEFNNSIARTIFNGNRYYAMLEDLKGKTFYIIDKKGVESISNNANIDALTVFIDCPWHIRAKQMRKRGDSICNIISRLINDRREFKGFKGDLNFNSSQEMYEYFKIFFDKGEVDEE